MEDEGKLTQHFYRRWCDYREDGGIYFNVYLYEEWKKQNVHMVAYNLHHVYSSCIEKGYLLKNQANSKTKHVRILE